MKQTGGWAPPRHEYQRDGYNLAHNRLKDADAAMLRAAYDLFTERRDVLDAASDRWEHLPRIWEIEGALRAIDDLLGPQPLPEGATS